jgi:hypothetical protein
MKRVLAVCWDKDESLLVGYLEMGSTIMAKYYSALLDHLTHQLVSKRCGKIKKGILFLQDNFGPYSVAITDQKLAGIHFEVVKQFGSFGPLPFSLPQEKRQEKKVLEQ